MRDIKAEVARKSAETLRQIKTDPSLSHYIPTDFIPSIFMEAKDSRNIQLVLLGQDPTVKKPGSRSKVTAVLNLDKLSGSLYKYVSNICSGLGLELSQHVYATNFVKNFSIKPPAQIKECDILDKLGQYWLPLLKEELRLFPGCPVLTLGEPLLELLLKDKHKAFVHRYWDYKPNWKQNRPASFSSVAPEENKLGRRLFPFPHQPSLRKEFYRATLEPYLNYVKSKMLKG
jgi:uracil-DNA glycosylase